MFNGVRCKSVQVPIFQQLSVYWDRPRNEKQYDAPSWAPCVIQQLPTSYLSILSMVTYTFQGYYLNSSHLLPPLCPQVSSLGKCLYSCPTNRFICTIYGSSVPFMVHPYHRVHICVNIWYLFFSFWLTSLCVFAYFCIGFLLHSPKQHSGEDSVVSSVHRGDAEWVTRWTKSNLFMDMCACSAMLDSLWPHDL